MPVYTQWDNEEKTITRLNFVHTFTLSDVFDAWADEVKLIESVSHPIYSLNDFTEMKMIIGGLNVAKIMHFIHQNQPSNLRMTIQVADNPTIRGVLHSIAKVMSHEVHIVTSLDKAYEIIERDQCLSRAS